MVLINRLICETETPTTAGAINRKMRRTPSSSQAARQLTQELGAAGHPVLAVEMEGAAVAQVCVDYGVPFAAVRTISDRADEDAPIDFLQFVRTVASPYAEHVVRRLLSML